MHPVIFKKNILDIDKNSIFSAFDESGLVAITGNKFSESMHREIAVTLGDRYSWVPNSNKKNFYQYTENHFLTFQEKSNSKPSGEELFDTNILVNWHLEHVHRRPMYVGALWLMGTFKCDKSSGMTGFVDACDVINELGFDEIEFLKLCKIKYNQNNLVYKSVENIISHVEHKHVPAIEIHRKISKPMLRMTPAFDGESLASFADKEPSVEELARFSEIKNKICKMIWTNRDLQFWWTWSEGDLLIVDLSRMYHSVTGGFELGQRELIGIHCVDDV